jgi:hypothetical protein
VFHGREEFRGQAAVGYDHQSDHEGFTKTGPIPGVILATGSWPGP